MPSTVDRAEPTQFDVSALWFSRAINRVRGRLENAFVASALTFGLLPTVVLALYVSLRWQYVSTGYLFSLCLYAVVLLVAPYLIWYYDQRLFPEFCAQFAEILRTEEPVVRIAGKYQRLYRDRWWVAAGLAMLPIPVITWLGQEFFRAHGLFGVTDPLFWLVELVLLWMGVIVGMGFLLVVVTLLVIREIADEQMHIDPLYPDGLGGMSVVGFLAIRSTVLFSLGALLIPLQLQFAVSSGAWATYLIYGMSGLYALAIGLSFLYPTMKINRRANELRRQVLSDLRSQYRELKQNAAEPEIGANVSDTDPAVEQKLQRIRREYQDYQEVQLYPMRLSILVRLVGSVLLPLVFVFIDSLLRPELVRTVLASLG